MIGKLTGKKVDCLVCHDHLAMILLKDEELASYSTTQIIFDFSVNKYQTNKYFSTTFFDWLSLTLQFAAVSHKVV